MRRLPAILGFLGILLAGCGGDDLIGPPPQVEYPPPGSPAQLMARLEKILENRDDPNYPPLLSEDFRYKFSADADPLLAQMYPNWGKDDEVETVRHWFNGFTNSQGDPVPAVSRIDLTFTGVQYGNDPDHPDSTAQYQKVVVTLLDATVEIPGTPDSLVYHVTARHDFYLVRGDAAVLSADSPADATHWYVRRWEDLAIDPFHGGNPVPAAARPATLGSLRASYRN